MIIGLIIIIIIIIKCPLFKRNFVDVIPKTSLYAK